MPKKIKELSLTVEEMGRRGGTARAISLSREKRSEIAGIASRTRWEAHRKNAAEKKANAEQTTELG